MNAVHEEVVRLPYVLLPWQRDVKRDRHRFRPIPAGRRSGKTHLLCDLLIEAALTYAKGLPCWYVAPTYGMAKDIAWSLLKDFTADLYRARIVTRYYETELRIDFWNGASIHLKGADNQDSLRGRGLGFLGIDEIALMHRDLWLKVLYPATSDHQAPVVFIGTPKGYNHFFELCEMEKKRGEDGELLHPDWKTFTVKTVDAGTLPIEEIENARRNLDEQSFRQEYEASFELFTGQIYHWEVRDLPVEGEDWKWDDVIYGLDFGYSVNPAAAINIYRRADEFWVEEKVYQSKLTNNDLGLEMDKAGLKGLIGYPDSAEPKSIQELRNMGFRLIPAAKGQDSVRTGIDFLKSKRIYVARGSENILREMRSYQWKTDKGGFEVPEPVKENDHAMDAIRYAIFTHYGRRQTRIG